MAIDLLNVIQSGDAAVRDTALDALCGSMSREQLLAECERLEQFRKQSQNLYERVRALFFLHAIYRYFLPPRLGERAGLVPFGGYSHLLARRFEEAIDVFLAEQKSAGPSDAIASALAAAYKDLAFQTLANQVRRSVKSVKGNQWMFRTGHPADHPLRLRPELLQRSPEGLHPILAEETPVRMDLSHSAWSDIFFLGMDFPEGARVLNVSIDLAVQGRDSAPRPPVEAYLRVIDEPVLRLVSVDLGARADLTSLSDVFDFARDYLGLLKAAVIASGLVPPGLEGSGMELSDLLARVVAPGHGLEIVSSVNSIPKGSRLAVSTNLLGALIAVCMRATGQARNLTGMLEEDERRLIAARAILGEWLGGSGGGWQDSGGVWPGMKVIAGARAEEGDPEFGISRGRLLPVHRILGEEDASAETRRKLEASLVLVHGGMAQNVGPILEMVTEKYLLRLSKEWAARKQAMGVLDEILVDLKQGDIAAVGSATTRNFGGPIQAIIPWATNFYTETLIARTKAQFGDDFWGFWMLGGMSGGGMGFIFAPHRKPEAMQFLQQMMSQTRKELEHALPFAMEPVVYSFAINDRGSFAQLLEGDGAILPANYYGMMVPQWLRTEARLQTPMRRAELDHFAAAARTRSEFAGMVEMVFDRMLPRQQRGEGARFNLKQLLAENGFDAEQHERVRADLRSGRIGLNQNRLQANTEIRDVEAADIVDTAGGVDAAHTRLGEQALSEGRVAVLSLAAGAGSRWTQGAGVCKALHPFCRFAGRHRTFVEMHLAKSRQTGRRWGAMPAHLFATSYLTHRPVEEYLARAGNYGYTGDVRLSRGKSVGLRMIPTERDLRFAWEEMPQKMLDEQQEKVRQSLHAALIIWAKSMGEAADYADNIPSQCLHPVGHWYEVPNLFRNGVLAELLEARPQLKYLMLHNIDTVGANLNPSLLGLHIARGSALSFEVISRRLEDRGGGLAKVDGRVRLLEGLAMPHEEDEFALRYYNTMTTWIDVDALLALFGLSRGELRDEAKVMQGIRSVAVKMPTYITLKDVKKRWGHGQEDIYPVAQFEKLWSDMTALPDAHCSFFVVPRSRGQQLKDQAQLDGWLRDGSAAAVEQLCDWG
jgi:hypothetical protein